MSLAGMDAWSLNQEIWLDFFREYCREDILELADHYPKERQSLYVEARDLLQYRSDDEAQQGNLLDAWLDDPERHQEAAESALKQFDLPVDMELGAFVRLTDSEGIIERISVSELTKDHIGKYVAIEGDLSRITAKKPRVDEAAFRCVRCETLTRVKQNRSSFQDPHECRSCERKGPFNLDEHQTEWVDQRKIKLEEPIEERAKARGRSVPCYLDDDLCDYSPGDGILPDHSGERATVLGTVQFDESELTGRNGSPETDYWLDACAIVLDVEGEHDIDVEEHLDDIEEFASRDDAAELVGASIAPGLHAAEDSDLWTAKRVAAAWLFNGYRMDNDQLGAKRGDFHVGIFGDPGVGKSSLMKDLDDLSPQSEFRSAGTGMTEAGLTSAATQEEFAGVTEWTLEPGVLPRADGGHCLIDEIDAVVDEDTKAIHDALEGEQLVKVDKAGIQADLPTRCPVLVGGNPEHTRFDKYEPITDQIDIDPALFDRLDIVLAIQDEVDEESDADTAEHVLDTWSELSRAESGDLDPDNAEASNRPVAKDTLRAWVAYAREEVQPTLEKGDEVYSKLKDEYIEIRDLNDQHSEEDGGNAVPATVRTLEGMIRLSMAFARLRLSDTIEMEDAERAIGIAKDIVGLRFDPETGQFDRERTARGQPSSQRERVKTIKSIVDELADEYDGGGVPVERVVSVAEEEGIDASKAENEIEKLAQKGELYWPQSGEVLTS